MTEKSNTQNAASNRNQFNPPGYKNWCRGIVLTIGDLAVSSLLTHLARLRSVPQSEKPDCRSVLNSRPPNPGGPPTRDPDGRSWAYNPMYIN